MAKPLPKWAMQRYATLWKKFSHESFSFEDALDVLGISANVLSMTLRELRSGGWITITLDEHDARKRTYHLVDPESAIGGMA